MLASDERLCSIDLAIWLVSWLFSKCVSQISKRESAEVLRRMTYVWISLDAVTVP